MQTDFGMMADGRIISLYTISCGQLTAEITDLGATLVRLWVPDRAGNRADVVLGFDNPADYIRSGAFLGATVGRNANRVKDAAFVLEGTTCALGNNENGNNLHSGPDFYKDRLWRVVYCEESSIMMRLESPNGDQGFPGDACISVTYTLEADRLRIDFDGISDRDTVFNLTNHRYFTLAGHDHPERAMEQTLILPGRFFVPADEKSIPTGQLESVAGTPMDFRAPKALKTDMDSDYYALKLQNGYDHTFEVYTDPGAILCDPVSGRTMAVTTDCPGVQLYTGNFLNGERGKDGVCYPARSGICLETQYYPNSINTPQWTRPVTPAGERYRSTTQYIFHW